MSFGGWQSEANAREDVENVKTRMHRSVGYFFMETDTAMSLVMSRALELDSVGELFVLPRAMVRSVRVVEKGDGST